MVQYHKKVFVCIAGSGKEHIYETLKLRGLNTCVHTALTKDDAHELFSSRKTLTDDVKDKKRFTFVINDEKDVTNKVMKNYNVLVLSDNRCTLTNDQELIRLYNMADYFIDCKHIAGKVANTKEVNRHVDDMVEDLVRKLR